MHACIPPYMQGRTHTHAAHARHAPTHARTHTYTNTHAHTHAHTHEHTRTVRTHARHARHARTHAHTHTHTHTHTHRNRNRNAHTWTHAWTQVCTHARIHAYTYYPIHDTYKRMHTCSFVRACACVCSYDTHLIVGNNQSWYSSNIMLVISIKIRDNVLTNRHYSFNNNNYTLSQ